MDIPSSAYPFIFLWVDILVSIFQVVLWGTTVCIILCGHMLLPRNSVLVLSLSSSFFLGSKLFSKMIVLCCIPTNSVWKFRILSNTWHCLPTIIPRKPVLAIGRSRKPSFALNLQWYPEWGLLIHTGWKWDFCAYYLHWPHRCQLLLTIIKVL